LVAILTVFSTILVAPAPTTVPEIINWPVQSEFQRHSQKLNLSLTSPHQERKIWRGKGHLPTWTDHRRVASEAIDKGLKTYSLEQLVDIVKVPCREAGLKASSNKRDKNAQVKREYHDMVMGLLESGY
jgi:hypothetical protein